MTAQIQFRDMRTEVDTKFNEAVYRDIIAPSFGPDELDPLDTVLDGLAENGSYEAWGLCALDGETPVGCILGYPYPETGVLLIGYVSVRPGTRGGGVGGLLLDAARRRWYAKPGLTLVLAEIEDPRFHPVVDGVDPERRVAFYARHGVQVVVGPYIQPRVEGEGKKRVYGVFLSVLHGATGPGRSVSAPQIAAFLTAYYRASAEASDWPRADDREGSRLLDWYRSRRTVGLHPIGRYREIDIPQVQNRATGESSN